MLIETLNGGRVDTNSIISYIHRTSDLFIYFTNLDNGMSYGPIYPHEMVGRYKIITKVEALLFSNL